MLRNEDVYAYFRTLPGTKRIELVCGLLELCIPLEVRFFHSYLQDLTKKECNIFREAEQKANSLSELEKICKCDLLIERMVGDELDDSDGHVSSANEVINGGGELIVALASDKQRSAHGSTSELATVGIDTTTTVTVASAQASVSVTKTDLLKNYPTRSRLIISLCLLEPNNSPCSQVAYNLINNQLMVPNIAAVVYGVLLPKGYPLDLFYNEINLLLTIAIHHPAFTYEQRDLMQRQKLDIENFFATLGPSVVTPHMPATPFLCFSSAAAGLAHILPASSSVEANNTTGAPFLSNPMNAQTTSAAMLSNSLSMLRLNSQPPVAPTVSPSISVAAPCLECVTPPGAPSYAPVGLASSSSASSNSVSPKSSPHSGGPGAANYVADKDSTCTKSAASTGSSEGWPKLSGESHHHHQSNYANTYSEGATITSSNARLLRATSPPKSYSSSVYPPPPPLPHHHHHPVRSHNRPLSFHPNRDHHGSSGGLYAPSSHAHSSHHNSTTTNTTSTASVTTTASARSSGADDRLATSKSPTNYALSNISMVTSCYNCGKPGHRGNECSTKPSNTISAPAVSDP